jgi:hypothetical protein
MKPAKILQATSILAALQYAAHAALFLSAAPTHGREEIAVVETMKAHRFDIYGFDRSYWDFYFGYGLLAVLSGVIEVVILWQLATLAKTDPNRVRPFIATFIFANVAHATLMWRYFFLGPLVFDVAVAACLGWALLAARADQHAFAEAASSRSA